MMNYRSPATTGVLFHYDSARPRMARSTQGSIGWQLLQYPLTIPTQHPEIFTYHVCGPPKSYLSGRRFVDDKDVESEEQMWLRHQPKGGYAAGIVALVKGQEKCITVGEVMLKNKNNFQVHV